MLAYNGSLWQDRVVPHVSRIGFFAIQTVYTTDLYEDMRESEVVSCEVNMPKWGAMLYHGSGGISSGGQCDDHNPLFFPPLNVGYTPPPNSYGPANVSIWSLRYNVYVVVSIENHAPACRPSIRISASPRLTDITIIHLYVTTTGVT